MNQGVLSWSGLGNRVVVPFEGCEFRSRSAVSSIGGFTVGRGSVSHGGVMYRNAILNAASKISRVRVSKKSWGQSGAIGGGNTCCSITDVQISDRNGVDTSALDSTNPSQSSSLGICGLVRSVGV